MSITVNIKEAETILVEAFKAKLVPMMVGSPAIGKSSIVHQIAKKYGLKLIDLRLSQCDPTDLLGFPYIDQARKKAMYMPMSSFPVKGDAIPEGFNGWLLFLDEFNSADRDVQKAAYKLILDRMIGEFDLHPEVYLVCAGNKATDGAIVEDMSTALRSRLIHIELRVDFAKWIEWASENGIDHRITSFLNFKPGLLDTFKADMVDKTYASPRTWEFANRLLTQMGIEHNLLVPTLAGTISEGVAREFVAFTKIYQNLPTLDKIRRAPTTIDMPDEPSILYALTGLIGHRVTEENIKDLMLFVERMPIEYQMVCLQDIIKRHPKLESHSEVKAWIKTNAKQLL